MLSYRHIFHAGNHADVLKHLVLFLTLDYFNQKDKPYWYIDTHSGAGEYDLASEYALKTQESVHGFQKLQKETAHLPEELKSFISFIDSYLKTNNNCYPGSPKIAANLVRSIDSLRLFELHPTDSRLLIDHFRGFGRKAQIKVEDGYHGLISILPPAPRRAITLIDPPYEEKQDYDKVVYTLKEALKRFQTGCYLVWYPCLSRIESKKLPEQLKKIQPNNYLDARLYVENESPDGFGMFGSGMFIINPPYPLKKQLQQLLPILAKMLAQDTGAHYELNAEIK